MLYPPKNGMLGSSESDNDQARTMNHHPHTFDTWVQDLHEKAEKAQNQAAYVQEYSRALRERSAWLRDRRRCVLERSADLLEHRLELAERLNILLAQLNDGPASLLGREVD